MLLGCNREQIQTITVPKETQPVSAQVAAAAGPSAPARIRWTTPPGWQEQAAGGMRVASFTVTKDGKSADVSVIPLSGPSGSELDNVNRWRGQVGLEALDAAKLAASAEKVSIGSTPAPLYEMAGTDPQTKQPARILGSILQAEGSTWFFKMLGPDSLVAEQKPAFVELLKSVRFDGAAASDPVAEAHRPVSTNTKDITGGHGSAAGKPTWEVPTGWEEQPPSSMRIATFHVTGQNGAKADLSVTRLAGTAGGMLANVNRWRSQLGLDPVDEAGLERLLTHREASGSKVSFVDLVGRNVESGEPARMLVAIVPRAGTTWFYKLMGPPELLERHKDAFVKFVETARYPNAS